HPGDAREQGRAWRAVASRVVAQPVMSLLGGLALIGVMAAGLFGTSVGLDQVEKFRVQSESATGLEVLSEHFPPGEAQPIFIVADNAGGEQVVDAAANVDRVIRTLTVKTNDDTSLTEIMVPSQYAPSTEQSLDQITQLRDPGNAIPVENAVDGRAV